jgi:hypothetical protein
MKSSFFNPGQSGKRGAGFAFILVVALGSGVGAELRAQVVVVPNAMAANDGNSSITAPQENSSLLRIMEIYDASQFGSLSGPSLLTRFAERPDRIPGPSGPRTQTMRIYASTTSRSVAGLSTTFANNIGTNNTLVFDGTATLSTENLPGPGNTRQFDIVYPLTTPFLYDPADGNLLLDFRISSGPVSAFRWDGVSGNPTVRAVVAFGSSTALTGSYADSDVYQFTFELPPQVTIRTSQVEVCWSSQSNLTYQVQYSSDLTTNLWTSLEDCIRSINSTSCIYDPIVLGQPHRFYRVVLTNCVQ